LKPTLCTDVDSTIWDTGAWVCSAVLAITGETLDMDRITTWTLVLDTYGEQTTTAIFDRVFDPERVRDRKPYPGASEVLRALQESQGIELHFVTHNDPDLMTPHLEPWLRTHFGPDVGLTVTREDKLDILEQLDAFGLIDDRPDTIGRVADAGLWAAAKIQPWNRDLLTRRSDIHGFSHWQEVPALLPTQYRTGVV
jgi:phosphoglycolate phosphatase-like HAD superfamily hydrolase